MDAAFLPVWVLLAIGSELSPVFDGVSGKPEPAASGTTTGLSIMFRLDVSSPQDLAAELAPVRERFGVPALAAAVVRSNRLVGLGCVGVRKQGEATPVSSADCWHLGSLTKSMTATLAAVLVEEGRLSWQTTLAEVFPTLAGTIQEDWRGVTLEQLLAHRGGAPADLEPGGLWARLWQLAGSPREQRRFLVEQLTARPPATRPGTTHEYSNAGYALAGAMLEEITGRSWEELMREKLFQPLGLRSAGFGPPAASGQVNQPWGHVFRTTFFRGTRAEPVPPGPGADNPPAVAPAGAVHASLTDLAAYAAFHLAGARGIGSGLRPETFAKLHTDVAGQGYALGWVVARRPWAGGRTLSHTGSNTQWYANLWLAPERDFAVAIVTNVGGNRAYEATDAVAGRLIARFLD